MKIACSRRVAVGRLFLVVAIVGGGFTDAGASRTPDEIKQARERVESTGNAVRTSLKRQTGLGAGERDVLDDVKFAYSPSQLPSVQSIRQFGQRKVIVSDGWVSLVEDLTRAELLARPPASADCFHEFARKVLSKARTNLSMTRSNPRAAPLALPRFASYVEDRENHECAHLHPSVLRASGIDRAVRVGVDAALWWALGRELALQFDPRDTGLPSSVAANIAMAASAAAAASAPSDKVEALSVKLRADAVANELRCRADVAEVRAVERGMSARVDVAAAFMAVVAQEAIFERDGDDASCPDGMARLTKFLDAVQAGSADDPKKFKERVLGIWGAVRPVR